MAITVNMFQTKDSLKIGEFQRYTAATVSSAALVAGSIFTLALPDGLLLDKCSVYITNTVTGTYTKVPYTLAHGMLSVVLPALTADVPVLVSITCKKYHQNCSINAYSAYATVNVAGAVTTSNTVSAINQCNCCKKSQECNGGC